MDLQTISAIIFILVLSLLLYLKRKDIQVQKIIFPVVYFLMYRTKAGLKLMNSMAEKHRRLIQRLAFAGIILGFVGMAFICYGLVKNIYDMFIVRAAAPGVGLVLPFKVKGAFYVPFFYWIISIFVIAVVHEFSHGVVARAYNIRVKSSGLAFLGVVAPILPAAFVEPDEKEIPKKSHKAQMSVFAAGPFSNILLGFLFLAVMLFIAAPVVGAVLNFNGVLITDFVTDENNMTLPAESAGIAAGEIIKEIDGIEVNMLTNFSDVLQNRTPGQEIMLTTDKGEYNITLTSNPEDENQSYLGVFVQQNADLNQGFIDKYGIITARIILWFTGSHKHAGLFYWLYLLNIGIGLFNLVPIGPLDGGRMLNTWLNKMFKKENALKILSYVSLFFLALVLINIMAAFMR